MTTISTRNPNAIASFMRVAFMPIVMLLLFAGNGLKAQVIYSEPFTLGANLPPAAPFPHSFLPIGWSQGKVSGVSANNQWDVVNTGGLPTCAPRSASTMMRFQSFFITTGEASFLASKRLDMRAMPAGGANFNFWFWRDNTGYLANADRIQVWVNDSAVFTAGSPSQNMLLETVSGAGEINRSCSLSPGVTGAGCNAWNNLFYNIPQSIGPNIYGGVAGANSVYIMIVGISAFGNNMFVDDLTLDIWANAQTYTLVSIAGSESAKVIQQNVATTGLSATNQMIIGSKMVFSGLASPLALTNMEFNTNGSDNPPADMANAKLWFSGGSSTFSTVNAIPLGTWTPTVPSPWATNYRFLDATSINGGAAPATFSGLQHGDNYFWITYDIRPTATPGNYVDAEWISYQVAAATNVPTIQTLTGRRLIDMVYCVPTYFVGTAWAGYNTNDFINGVRLTGDLVPGPGIQNHNGLVAGTGPLNNGANTSNWITTNAGSRCSGAPRWCGFQSHPPDYELFGATQTASMTVNNTAQYPITAQTGDYGSGNALAAWIDYNRDGIFNNLFDTVIRPLTAGVAAGVNTILVSNNFGLNAGVGTGMFVTGPGITPGTRVINMTTGSPSTLTLSANVAVGMAAGVNLTFVNPPSVFPEKVLQSGPLGAFGVSTDQFTIPSWATPGKTRMRVREVWINYNIDPCAAATYGEVEDYEVTIVPDCPGVAGYVTWLGFTDDWTDPANWCPPTPPLNPTTYNIRFPGGPTGSIYPYTHAKIKSSVQATANKMRIEAGDTVYIDAPTVGYLDLNDSLIIKYHPTLPLAAQPNSALIINTTKIDTAQVNNGLIPRIADSPMKPALKTRSFLLFTQAELLLQGFANGDVVDSLFIHMKRNSNGNVYKNFKVKYYWTGAAVNVSGTVIPAFSGVPNPAVLIYSGDLDVTSIAAGGSGTIKLPLIPGAFVFSNLNRKLVLDISYDFSPGGTFPLTGTVGPNNEDIRFTQTGATYNYACVSSNSQFPTIAENLTLDLGLAGNLVTTTANGGGSTNQITVASVVGLFKGMYVTAAGASGLGGSTIIDIVGSVVTLSATSTAALFTGTSFTFRHYFLQSNLFYRPNVTFSFTRPYGRYPMRIAGNWENNGTFIPAKSIVTFDGVAQQKIDGTTNSEFYNLYIGAAAAANVVRFTDFTVTDSLRLVNGRLKLNNGMVTLTNPAVTSLTFTGVGDIQADADLATGNIAPYGRLAWNMGAVPGLRVIPFINFAADKVPLDYFIDSGTHNVVIGTYRTLQDNTNIPLPEVDNILGIGNAVGGGAWGQGGWTMADRYYLIDNTASTLPIADITFRYAATEQAQAGNINMRAQRWINTTDLWEFPFQPGQTFTAGATNSVKLDNFGGFDISSWWTIVGEATPLPVSLLEFRAEKHKDKVKLLWSTASEINNSYFEVERTLDNDDFQFIGRVESKGPGNNRQEYFTWDNNPVNGVQYYYLKQFDYDGKSERFGPVSATFSKDVFEIVTATVSSSDHGLTVVFNYNSTEPYSYRIMDMTGRLIVAKDRNSAVDGLNVIDIDATLAKGAYHIILQNSSKIVSRKFFY